MREAQRRALSRRLSGESNSTFWLVVGEINRAARQGNRIPRPIRKAVKLALAAPNEEGSCAACHESMGIPDPECEPTPCCHTCAQTLLAMLAEFIDERIRGTR